MFNVSAVFGVFNLIMRVLQVVQAVEAAMPGHKGAEKSAAVIAKVEPIANALGAQQENVQGIIDVGVALFNQLGVFRRGHPDHYDQQPAKPEPADPAQLNDAP